MKTPSRDDLELSRIENEAGLAISLLPSGAIFAIEHGRIMLNQSLASPIAGEIGRIYLRVGGANPQNIPLTGPEARYRFGVGARTIVWAGECAGLRYHVSLGLHPQKNLWLWRVEIVNQSQDVAPCDIVFIQDIGLGDRNFLMNNEAYASQYLDSHVASHPRMNTIVMSRQNLSQHGGHPWAEHGCLEGVAGFATDLRQIFGPRYRDGVGLDCAFGTDLPSERVQSEAACAALQSRAVTIAPRDTARWTFFGMFLLDHPAASSDADLALLDEVERFAQDWAPTETALQAPRSGFLQMARPAEAKRLSEAEIAARYAAHQCDERDQSGLLSFFTGHDANSRHIILRDKERVVARRHGAILRSGQALLPDDSILCMSCWMHGVFGAQLTIGNTSFHQLFSVSRDPYNITRGNGLRMLIETDDGWRLLTTPSVFEIGLSDCKWIYVFAERQIIVSATVSGADAAAQWTVSVEGKPCRVLVFGQLTLGEFEYAHAGETEIDHARRQFTFRPDPLDKWGQHYPRAVYHLVTATPSAIEAVGGDELLYVDGERRGGGFIALRTAETSGFSFAVVGALTQAEEAHALAVKYAAGVAPETMTESAHAFWNGLTRGLRVQNSAADAGARALDAIIPWFVHDAIIHLTTPHGLEQYMGAAWGTRDVCQGPVELLLALEHDAAVKEILRVIFAQQYENKGDWPQWFMLEPYSFIQDRHAHGDVIVWPLKALCDYIEATGDFAFLDEAVAWRGDEDMQKTDHKDPMLAHIDKLVETLRQRFIVGTHLVRYDNGDWNDSLQPADPSKRDWMVSSWTVGLLYQQLRRYAEILQRAGRNEKAQELEALAVAMRTDFHRYLIRDNVVAGYALFSPAGEEPELLLHPGDRQTGVSYSLIAMTQAIMGGLLSPEQIRHHVALIRQHLLFADGARLMDMPIAYHGGPERIFRRAESAAFFGREIGLMYVHSHLRYAEIMAQLGDADALWEALLAVNPIAVTEQVKNASLRQRNAYFSSSDAAFRDRYQSLAEWSRVKDQSIAVDGGWRIYSSGPGIYVRLLIQHVFGRRREFGQRLHKPCLPAAHHALRLNWSGADSAS